MPRLAFTDNMFSAISVAINLGINFTKTSGVFWGQCLEETMRPYVEDGNHDYILTVDYDSIFSNEHVWKLFEIMDANPHIDALAPWQTKRECESFMMGALQENGQPWSKDNEITSQYFKDHDITRASWAHFGLTMLRTSALRRLPHPWFIAEPNDKGLWQLGKVEEDMHFWKIWYENGNTLYTANRVAIGHAQLMFSWPSDDAQQIFQFPRSYHKNNQPPAEVWK